MSNSDHTLRRRAFVDKDECPMARTATLLGDKWTLLILREAFYGVQRFDDMRADLGAPRAMLTDRLSKLVDAGIMTRRPYQEPGARTRSAYALTSAGRDLALTLIAMKQWGERHILGGPGPVKIVDRETGASLRLGLVSEDGAPVVLTRAALAKRED